MKKFSWLPVFVMSFSVFAQAQNPSGYSEKIQKFIASKKEIIERPGQGFQPTRTAVEAGQAIQNVLEEHLRKFPVWNPDACYVADGGQELKGFEGTESQFQQWVNGAEGGLKVVANEEELVFPYAVAIAAQVKKEIPTFEKEQSTIENFEDYKKTTRQTISKIRAEGMEPVVSFERGNLKVWGIQEADVEAFYLSELKLRRDQWTFTGDASKNTTSVGEIIGRKPLNPQIKLSVRVQYVRITCAKREIPRPPREVKAEDIAGDESIQMHWYGAVGKDHQLVSHAMLGKAASSVFAKLKEPNENGQAPITRGTVLAIEEIESSPDIISKKLDIEELTGCGVTLDFEIRVWEGEIYRANAYMTHVAVGSTFLLQGYNDSTVTPVRVFFPMDSGHIRDIRPESRGISPLSDYLSKLDYIYEQAKNRKIKCERPTRHRVMNIIQ